MSDVVTELPIGAIKESNWNPRKNTKDASLQELVSSVKQFGIITPLLVRKKADNGYWELAAGHRRLRAAIVAGLKTVPVTIREMDDVTFREILMVENLQREDVGPLDEAMGYEALLKGGKSVAQLAARVSKSEKYIYDRLSLLKLTPACRKMLDDGVIPVGHATLLSRLKKEDQKRAVGDPTRGDRLSGMFTFEFGAQRNFETGKREGSLKPVSLAEFQKWIDDKVRFDRKNVDAFLFEDTAEDLAKAKEKHEKIVPITLDYMVPPEAKDEKDRTFTQRSWMQADGKVTVKPFDKGDTKKCEKSVLGVFVVGERRGQTLRVCVDRTCPTHFPKKKVDAKAKDAVSKAEEKAAEQQKKYQEMQEKAQRELALWRAAKPALCKAIDEAIPKCAATVEGPIGQYLLGPAVSRKKMKGTATELVHLVAIGHLHDEAGSWNAAQRFPKLAKAFGIDYKAILKNTKVEAVKDDGMDEEESHGDEPEEQEGDDAS